MEKILIIYTGGTIGMDYHNGDPNSYLQAMPLNHLLKKIDNWQVLPTTTSISSVEYNNNRLDFISLNTPIDSAAVNVEIWQKIAQLINFNYDDYQAFVVLHGTDTLAYTASALSFIFSNHKAIILTGSILPIGFENSDAWQNIKLAVDQALNPACVNGVWIAWQNYLIKGNNASKTGLNDNYFAAWRNNNAYMNFENPNIQKFHPKGENESRNNNESVDKQINLTSNYNCQTQFYSGIIDIVFLHPFCQEEYFHYKLNSIAKFIIILAYGSGNIPQSELINQYIKQALDQQKVIAISTQCVGGKVASSYATSSLIIDDRLINLQSMTIESSITKLCWAIANVQFEKIKEFMEFNQKGEL